MRHYLSLVTVLHNDARFLREYLEYHLLVGVEHFYLYDHNSTDSSYEVLTPYILKGLVTYTFVPDEVEAKDLAELQCTTFARAVDLARDQSRWLAVIDSDEFLVPKAGTNLASLLRNYEDYGGLAANWQMFGTASVERVPAHASLLALLNRRAPTNYHMNKHVKLIIQPARVLAIEALHQATYQEAYYTVDSAKRRVEGPFNEAMPLDVLQVNHYFCRDRSYLHEVKLARRVALGNDPAVIEQWEREMNAVVDGSLSRLLPQLALRLELSRFPLYYSWRCYLANYPDLAANGVRTEWQAAQHWLDHGQKERRRASFDWRRYLRLNSDLRRNGLVSEDQAVSHWLAHGRRERRPA
jgi:Glycosyltransferase family 92